MNVQTAGLDVDGVLADLFTPWTDWLSERHGVAFGVEDWLSWSEPELRAMKGWRDFLTADVYDVVDPYPGAVEAVSRLRDSGVSIEYITVIAGGAEQEKLDWLKGHGFFQNGDVYHPLPIAEDHTHGPKDHDVDVLIDDGFHNVVEAEVPAILISRPWNMHEPWGLRAEDMAHAVDMILHEDRYAYVW